jgi:fatty-acyl-CoA synthase
LPSAQLHSPTAIAETLTEVLLRRLDQEPAAEVCRLVGADGQSRAVTVKALMDKAMAYAELYGPPKPQRKLIGVCLYHGLDLLAAFVGALISGHIPTMLAPPSPRMEVTKYADSFARMLKHIQLSILVVDSQTTSKLDQLGLGFAFDCQTINPEGVPEVGFAEWRDGEPDEIALLQHSSGTTGLQKGTAFSHRAILQHNKLYAKRLGITSNDCIVSWLPLYHDMGLVACFLLPLLSSVKFVQISPFDWVLRPSLLLDQIAAERGTLCWLPNFAYKFMAENIRDSQLRDDLDLSSIRTWVNCSEPVYDSSHRTFLEKFSRYGVSERQLTASYAMAENVFAVSQSLPGEYKSLAFDRFRFTNEQAIEPSQQAGAMTAVSNGLPLEGVQVAIIAETGERLPEDKVGEVTLRSDYLFSGYFLRPELTREAMTDDGWYKTGDLGFLHDGEVYVTGRKKDLIIIQGRNFWPTDIESVAATAEGVIPGRVVAFGLADEKSGTERLVILAEIDEAAAGREANIAMSIRKTVAQELEVVAAAVQIVGPRWLIKSTAGKLARNDNRIKYLANYEPNLQS